MTHPFSETFHAHAQFGGPKVDLTADELDAKLSWHINNLATNTGFLELDHRDFRRANLSGKELRRVSLVDSDLTGATLVNADLSGSDLSYADLRGADCTGAIFHGTNLHQTKLQASVLRNADLTESIGLTPQQLRGSDLTQASLPLGVADADKTACAVDEASRVSTTLLLVTSIFSLYCWLTLFGASDLTLLAGFTGMPLPLLRDDVPAEVFFLAAPSVAFLLYFWTHSSLQSLWDALASLPARFPDGNTFREKRYSGVISPVIRAYLPLVEDQHPGVTRIQWVIARLLVWWAIPTTLLGFWLRFLVCKDPAVSWFQVVLLVTSVFAAQRFWHTARSTLETGAIDHRSRIRAGSQPGRLRPAMLAGVVALMAVLITQPLLTNDKNDASPHTRHDWPYAMAGMLGTLTWPPFFRVDGIELSSRPPAWNGEELTSVKGNIFTSRNLKYMSATSLFAVKSDFSHSNVSEADFSGADLRSARFDDATLFYTEFSNADLREASFIDARFHKVNLPGANLQGAVIYKTDFRRCDLQDSFNWILVRGRPDDYATIGLPKDHLDRLGRKDLSSYDLTALPYAVKLNYADLTDFSFRSAKLKGIPFKGAHLERADFRGADLENSTFTDADLEKADFRGVDLSHVAGLSAEQIRSAITDSQTQLPAWLR